MRDFKIVSFYTVSPLNMLYKQEAEERLLASLKLLNIEAYVEALESKKTWIDNCNMKAEFCQRMLNTYNMPIVWLDVDAVVEKYPQLFHELDEYDIAIGTSFRSDRPGEVVSSTIYFNNTDGARLILDNWVERCNIPNNNTWDQKHLKKTLEELQGQIKIFDLPRSYVKIFDDNGIRRQEEPLEPVITQYQCSRRLKWSVQ